MCGLKSMEHGVREALNDIAKEHGIENPETWLEDRIHASTSAPDRFYGEKWEEQWQARQQTQTHIG